MLTIDKISSGVRTAAMEYPIKKVDLFGSYADRKSNERSDVDLIVEFKTPMCHYLQYLDYKFVWRNCLGQM